MKNNNCNIFKDDLVEGSCFESIKDGYISKDIDEESSSFYRSIYCPIGKKIELKNQIPSLNINCNINKISQIQKTETDDMMNSDVSSMYTYRNTNASLNGYPNTQNLNFYMQSQTSASTFNQISNDIQNFKKREKGGKKNNKKNHCYKYFQVGIFFVGFAILIFQIISHITLYNSIHN